MKWIQQFQLILFDFDGLLVNTEHLHYLAYVNLLSKRGITLPWTFQEYSALAHLGATTLKEELYRLYPDLDPNWDALYEEKKELYLESLISGRVETMPGVDLLLRTIDELAIRRAVVTHSVRKQVELIKAGCPILKSIPNWITREDYLEPKPHPEGYLRAIERFSIRGDRIVGFEDSLRGIQALLLTPAQPVLVGPKEYPLREMALQGRGVIHFDTLLSAVEDLD